jgi:hypothetical protein
MSRRSNGDGVDETCSTTTGARGINNPLASSSADEKKNDNNLISHDQQQHSSSSMNDALANSREEQTSTLSSSSPSATIDNDAAASSSAPLVGGSSLHQQAHQPVSPFTFSSPLTVAAATTTTTTSSDLPIFATTSPQQGDTSSSVSTSLSATTSNNNNTSNKRKSLPQHDDDASYDALITEDDDQAAAGDSTAHRPQAASSQQQQQLQPFSTSNGSIKLNDGSDGLHVEDNDDTFTKAAKAFAARAQALSQAAEAAAAGNDTASPASVQDDTEGADQEVPVYNASSSDVTWKPQERQSVCEFTHTIKEYSQKRDSGCKKAEYSDITVDDCGNKWRLIVYVNGNGRASNHHLSLFLQVRAKTNEVLSLSLVVGCSH